MYVTWTTVWRWITCDLDFGDEWLVDLESIDVLTKYWLKWL